MNSKGASKMNRSTRNLVAANLTALLVALTPAMLCAQDKEYAIRTFVPEKVGNKRTVQKKMTQALDQVRKEAGKVIQEQHVHLEIEFSATVETLEVNSQGRETKVRLTVDKLMRAQDKEKAQELVRPGTLVIGELIGGKTIYRPREEEVGLSQLAQRQLSQVMDLAGTSGTELDVFETKQPQKVNGVWAAHNKRIIERFRRPERKLEPEAASGEGRLLGVKEIDGSEFLDIQIGLSVQMPGAPSFPDLAVNQTTLKLSSRILIPANYSSGHVEQTADVILRSVLKGKEGTSLAGSYFEMTEKTLTITKTTYLKK